MATQKERRVPLELGPAVLVTCIVQTLAESNSTFQARFLNRLERAYRELREDPKATLHTLAELSWVRELLTGRSVVSGYGEPFLGGVKPKPRRRKTAKKSS
jgi:hypothetical protein